MACYMVRSSTPSRSFTNSCCIGDVARNAEPHDFVTLSGLLKAVSLQLELKILAIYKLNPAFLRGQRVNELACRQQRKKAFFSKSLFASTKF